MSFQASFKQILREKMSETTTSTREFSSTTHSDPSHLAYQLGHVGRFEFSSGRGQYATAKAPGKTAPRKAHCFSPAQRLSFDFLKTWIHDLSEGYTPVELKKAFRQAALILHPDQGGSASQFLELKAHFEVLKTVWNP